MPKKKVTQAETKKRVGPRNPQPDEVQEENREFHAVGEIFEFNGKQYRVDPVVGGVYSCIGCAFISDSGNCTNKPACAPDWREDDADVIFREVEDKPTATGKTVCDADGNITAAPERKYHPLGEVFELNDHHYRVEHVIDEFSGCEGCAFRYDCTIDCPNIGCTPPYRADGLDVIFREVTDEMPGQAELQSKREAERQEILDLVNEIRDPATIEPTTKEAPALDDKPAQWPKEIPAELYDRLDYLGMLSTANAVRSHNVGASDYAQHTIQPWSIWLDYPELTSWDHDILKRILRTKQGTPRSEDYQKIIHICEERLRQLKFNQQE